MSGRHEKRLPAGYAQNAAALYGNASPTKPTEPLKAGRRKRVLSRDRDSEWYEQARLVKWLKSASLLVFSVPNGGSRNVVAGAQLKATGMSAGVPDLFLPIPTKIYHGLFIEMKRRDSSPSAVTAEQRWWIAQLAAKGYKAVVARGADEAMQVVRDYLGEK